MTKGLRYRHYIASEKWRNSPARLTELAEAHNRCRLCFRRATLRRRWKSTTLLTNAWARRRGAISLALCHECHDGVTSISRARRYRRRRPRRADVQNARDTRHTFIDPTKN